MWLYRAKPRQPTTNAQAPTTLNRRPDAAPARATAPSCLAEQQPGGSLSERSVRRIGVGGGGGGGRSRSGRCCASARADGEAERRYGRLWCRALDSEDSAGQAAPAARVQNDSPSTRALASPRLPAQHAPADRAARLQRGRLRDAATRRGRPGLPRHSPQRAVSHDLGITERALLHAERHALPEGADAGGTLACATVLRPRQVIGVAFFDFFHGQTGSPPTGSSFTRSSPTPASGEAVRRRLDRRDHRDPAGDAPPHTPPSASRRRHQTSTAPTSPTATSASCGTCPIPTHTISTATGTASDARPSDGASLE
jgi:hypothetical protein